MDTKTIAENALKGACKNFLKDLNALPEDAFLRNFGGVARNVADIVYEVDLVNDHIGMVMRQEEPFPWPEGGWITAPAELKTKEEVIRAFVTSSDRILATVAGFSSSDLEAPLKTDDGETNRFERCRFMTLHLWYHAGQLNFIQTMLGDAEWHWG
ncbi:MAG TPA: DinB family protein [Fimbriimonadaceae bacterium]|nr:DinB family protein [Fimbriimonadaceae bacterium]